MLIILTCIISMGIVRYLAERIFMTPNEKLHALSLLLFVGGFIGMLMWIIAGSSLSFFDIFDNRWEGNLVYDERFPEISPEFFNSLINMPINKREIEIINKRGFKPGRTDSSSLEKEIAFSNSDGHRTEAIYIDSNRMTYVLEDRRSSNQFRHRLNELYGNQGKSTVDTLTLFKKYNSGEYYVYRNCIFVDRGYDNSARLDFIDIYPLKVFKRANVESQSGGNIAPTKSQRGVEDTIPLSTINGRKASANGERDKTITPQFIPADETKKKIRGNPQKPTKKVITIKSMDELS